MGEGAKYGGDAASKGFPGGSTVKNPPANAGDAGPIPDSGSSPGEANGNPTPVLLPGESQGQRSLAGYSPRDGRESDTAEHARCFRVYRLCPQGTRAEAPHSIFQGDKASRRIPGPDVPFPATSPFSGVVNGFISA